MLINSRIRGLIFCTCILFSLSNVNATEIRWTAGKTLGADWNTPTNWDLGRVPLETDSVIAGYGDWVNITPGYTATCVYLKILSRLNISAGGKLWIKDGQFDALGEVNNYGSIKVINSPEEGMIFATQATDVVFENHGEIYIDQSVKEGFFIKFDQVFNNNAGGFIEIINAGLESFKVEGVFNNSGEIQIGPSAIDVAIEMNMSISASTAVSEINNLLCGKMVVRDQIVINDGTLNNDGLIRQNYDGENDLQGLSSTVNNNGIVEDIMGSFDDNDFDVESVWLYPLENLEVNTGEPTLPFETNFPANTTYSDIYTNKTLTQNAGTYDGATNTWIPNADANGLSTFFLEIGQSGGTCKDTVRFDLETPVIETIYWTGGNGNWQNGINWNTGNVPTANDLAGIYSETAEVFVAVGTDAYAKYLDLHGKLSIRQMASLNIDGSGSLRGFYVQKGALINNGVLNINNCTIGLDLLNSTLTNNLDITCMNTTTCIEIDQNVGQIAFLLNIGTISNSSGDLLNGDDAEIHNTGTLTAKFPTFFGVGSDNLINDGIIDVEGDGVNGRGVSGTIVNGVSGSIFVEKLDKGMDVEGSNNGSIEVDLCNRGVEISDNFINFSGAEIIIHHSDTGMLLSDGNIENRAGALISIKRSGSYGLRIPQPFVSSAYLFNRGLIEIDTATGIGILSSNDIINESSGVINVRNSGSHGYHSLSENAVLVNKDQAIIKIVKSGGMGLKHEGGTITNEGGQIIIDTSVLEGIHIGDYIDSPFIYASSFVNEAQIVIK